MSHLLVVRVQRCELLAADLLVGIGAGPDVVLLNRNQFGTDHDQPHADDDHAQAEDGPYRAQQSSRRMRAQHGNREHADRSHGRSSCLVGVPLLDGA
jgi:hypothetical protein